MSQTPWYKQFWPWFLIALPSAAVIAGISTVIIAVQHQHDLVAEDYYKKGKAINRDLSRIEQAVTLQVSATIAFDAGMMTVALQGEHLANTPLYLNFIHKTIAGRDQYYQLTADASGLYRLETAFEPSGHWMVQLGDLQNSWRLQQNLYLQTDQVIQLHAG